MQHFIGIALGDYVKVFKIKAALSASVLENIKFEVLVSLKKKNTGEKKLKKLIFYL